MADDIVAGAFTDICFAQGEEIEGLCINSVSLSHDSDTKSIKCNGKTVYRRESDRRQTATIEAIVREGYECPPKGTFMQFAHEKANQDWVDNFGGDADDEWIVESFTYTEPRQENEECTISINLERYCDLQPD